MHQFERLYWNEAGAVRCERHAPMRGSDAWCWEHWHAVPTALVTSHAHQCEYCAVVVRS